MKLSTSTFAYRQGDDLKIAVKTIKDAGFDAFDLNLTFLRTEDGVFSGDNYLQAAKELKEYADGLGIPCNQAHAPYPTSYEDAEKTEAAVKLVIRAMEISAVMGAPHIVVHPMQHLTYNSNREELKRINRDFYMSLLPYAQKLGIKIMIENMWQKEPYDTSRTKIVPSTCALAEEFCEYLDALPDEWFGACLDIGHVVLTNENLSRIIKMLGHKRLCALHVHDNNILEDLHTIPYLGKIPFDEVMSALKEIDYKGDFTFEAINFEKAFPTALKPSAARTLCRVGRSLINKM